MRETHVGTLLGCLVVFGAVGGCGDGDEGEGLSEAQLHGVGAACDTNDDCRVGERELTCLPFKGGYCGVEGCQASADCPAGSACVAHGDGKSYCFLVCTDKVQCNPTRPGEIESNCSSNIDFVDDARGKKACVPPS